MSMSVAPMHWKQPVTAGTESDEVSFGIVSGLTARPDVVDAQIALLPLRWHCSLSRSTIPCQSLHRHQDLTGAGIAFPACHNLLPRPQFETHARDWAVKLHRRRQIATRSVLELPSWKRRVFCAGPPTSS